MIIVRLVGGLGNQMFQYSAGLALALKHRVPLKVDLTFLLDRTPVKNFVYRGYDLDLFAIRASAAMRPEVPFIHRRHGSGRAGLEWDKLRRKVLPLDGSEARERTKAFFDWGPKTYLEGFWQSPRYFEHCEKEIRRDFTLKDPLPKRIGELCARLENANSVCVHVRRGDFVGNPFHGTLPQSYYTGGVARIADRYPAPKIYVFSDDLNWCRANLAFPWETTFVESEFAGPKCSHHFALMRACNHFVISNSSFSWWAAWLSESQGKLVVAPKHWYLDTSKDTSDITPSAWIRI